jgi:hypothetical protein
MLGNDGRHCTGEFQHARSYFEVYVEEIKKKIRKDAQNRKSLCSTSYLKLLSAEMGGE